MTTTQEKKKKKIQMSKTVINKVKRTERPGHSSVYFHSTSTLVCVMITFSGKEQGNLRLPTCPASGKHAGAEKGRKNL